MIVTRWLLLFVCYSTTLNNTDISTSSKDKAPVSTNGIETYSKKALNDKIRKLTTTNVQLITNKMETEKVKINLEANKTRLLDKKNSLIAKRKELRTKIAALYTAGSSNILVRGHQDPLLKPIWNKFKTKRLPPFDNLKENLQKFFIKTRYYQEFYQQSLPFDSDKVQDAIINIIEDISK